MADLMRGKRERRPVNRRSRRHQVEQRYSRFLDRHEIVLTDTSRTRHGEGGYDIGHILVDPTDQAAVQAATELLTGFAEQLNAHPLDWTTMRRKPKAA